jgi:hypothetical protein
MFFHSSPALRRIRQLARLIRRHPDLPVHSWNAPRNAAKSAAQNAARCSSSDQLNAAPPDPAQFVDSSVSNGVPTGLLDPNTRRKHANCPRSRAER